MSDNKIIDSKRDNKYYEIITQLNGKHRQGTVGYYNCGGLGIVHVYWWCQRWEHEWITISEEFNLEAKEVE